MKYWSQHLPFLFLLLLPLLPRPQSGDMWQPSSSAKAKTSRPTAAHGCPLPSSSSLCKPSSSSLTGTSNSRGALTSHTQVTNCSFTCSTNDFPTLHLTMITSLTSYSSPHCSIESAITTPPNRSLTVTSPPNRSLTVTPPPNRSLTVTPPPNRPHTATNLRLRHYRRAHSSIETNNTPHTC